MAVINSISDFFHYRISKPKDQFAIGKIQNGEITTLNKEQYRLKVLSLIQGIKEAGVKPGDHVGIWAKTSLEWHLIDLACLIYGAVTIPLYADESIEQNFNILKEIEPKALFTDRIDQVSKLKSLLNDLNLGSIIFINTAPPDTLKDSKSQTMRTYSYPELESCSPIDIHDLPKIAPSQVATIIYTSGTTGKPKGAIINHLALTQQLKNLHQFFQGSLTEKDKTLCFLPLSHVLGRCHSLLYLAFGVQTFFTSQSSVKLLDNLQIIRPSFLIAVPKIFEKIYDSVIDQLTTDGLLKQKISDWAESASEAYFRKIDQDLAPTTGEIILRQLAYKLVYSKIYDKFGGHIRFLVSGGAPLSDNIFKLMRNSNLTILEGYGLTETVGPCTVNPTRRQEIGSVGLPIGDVKIKINDDGEILIKSLALYTSYYQNDVPHENSLKDDWFSTGDLGELTSSGFLKITDRKKDIIVLSTGKNISPQKIEALLNLQKYIEVSMIIGEKRKFVTAIVGINKKTFIDQLEELNLERSSSYPEFSNNIKVRALIEEEINKVNNKLYDYEQVKKFIIAPFPIDLNAGHITPSFKLKRKVLADQLKNEIENMYKGP